MLHKVLDFNLPLGVEDLSLPLLRSRASSHEICFLLSPEDEANNLGHHPTTAERIVGSRHCMIE